MTRPVIYNTDHFIIREIHKQDGSITYGIFRDRGDHAPLDDFPDPSKALFFAGYCEDNHNGSYAAEARKAARDAWGARGVAG